MQTADCRPRVKCRLRVKALADEDTLLRTHCCRHKCFPVCPRAQHLLRTQFLCPGQKNVSDFVQKHYVSATNVFQFAQPKKHDEQQCVCNNVFSFARALKQKILIFKTRRSNSDQMKTWGSVERIFFSKIPTENRSQKAFASRILYYQPRVLKSLFLLSKFLTRLRTNRNPMHLTFVNLSAILNFVYAIRSAWDRPSRAAHSFILISSTKP